MAMRSTFEDIRESAARLVKDELAIMQGEGILPSGHLMFDVDL